MKTEQYRRLTPEGRSGLTVFGLGGQEPEELLKSFDNDNPRLAARRRGLYHGLLRDAEGDGLDEILLALEGDGRHMQVAAHGGRGVARALGQVFDEWGYADMPAPVSPVAQDLYDALRHVVSPEGLCHFLSYGDGLLPAAAARICETASAGQIEASLAAIDELTVDYRLRRGLIHPPCVAIIGPENAGKSTLFNRLIGYERVVVTDIPGTTADHVDETVIYRGFPIRLADTRGFPAHGDDPDLIRELKRLADFFLVVSDSADDGCLDISGLPAENCIARIISKIDLAPAGSEMPAETISVSGLTGEGTGKLLDRIFQAVAGMDLADLTPGCFTPGQKAVLDRARADIMNGRSADAVAGLDTYFQGTGAC